MGVLFNLWYNSNMKKNILNLDANWLADLAIFIVLGITPLFFNYFYPISIDLSKIVIFKVFTLLLLFAVVWRLVGLRLLVVKNSWRRLLPLVLLFVFLIFSLFFSVDIATSWFGSYDREEGLVSWLFYGLWAFLLIIHLGSYPAEKKTLKINSFIKISSLSGLLVSIYAIFQILGFDFVSWSEPATLTGRVVSSFGQPNYLACWLVLVLPLSLYLVWASKKRAAYCWLVVFVFQFITLILTGSRATFFIFLAVLMGWLVWFLNKKRLLSVKKILLISGVILVVLIGFLAFLTHSNQTRLAEFTDIKKGSLAVRLNLYQTGWQAFLKKPWLGYGLENQKEAYVGYYKTDFALYARPNTYSDRAHNLILDILLTSGLIGFVFFVYFFYWIFNNLTKALKDRKYGDFPSFLGLSLAAYLSSLLFNFSVTITNIYFWFIVALTFVISGQEIFLVKNEKRNFDLGRIILIIGTAILFFYGSWVELKKIEADYYYNKALVEINNSQYFTALVFKDYIKETQPNEIFLTYYDQGISLHLLEKLPIISSRSAIFVISQYLLETEKRITDTNFENKFIKAFILGMSDNQRANQLFNELALLSPELPKIYLAWGDSLMFTHNYKEALVKFERASRLLPDSNNKYINADQKKRLNFYKEQVNLRLTKTELLLK